MHVCLSLSLFVCLCVGCVGLSLLGYIEEILNFTFPADEGNSSSNSSSSSSSSSSYYNPHDPSSTLGCNIGGDDLVADAYLSVTGGGMAGGGGLGVEGLRAPGMGGATTGGGGAPNMGRLVIHPGKRSAIMRRFIAHRATMMLRRMISAKVRHGYIYGCTCICMCAIFVYTCVYVDRERGIDVEMGFPDFHSRLCVCPPNPYH